MIDTHSKIIALWPSPKHLAERIGEEYKGKVGTEGVKMLHHSLRMAAKRNSINSKLWRYICRVAAADFEHGKIDILVTLDLLTDTQPKMKTPIKAK